MTVRVGQRNASSRRNALGFIGEVGFFYLGIAFASTTTILPSFVGSLTTSAVLVGLILTLAEGAWRLPQLLVANWLSVKKRKKPYLTRAALLSRPAYLILAVALWAGIAARPTAALVAFFVLHFGMYVALSIDSLVWWDVFAKAIPLERRGRVLGAGTVLQGILSIGAASIVALVLGSQMIVFPDNYALLFALSSLFLLTSLLCWLAVQEPSEDVPTERPPWRLFSRQVLAIAAQDRLFRQFLWVRLLAGFEGLALGFYILFAVQVLQLPSAMIGVFAAVQTAGAVVGGTFFGWVSERLGNHRLIQVATLVSCTAPVAACAFSIARPTGATAYLFAWVFFAAGMFSTALFVGFNSLAVELAPAGERGIYIGIFNTASGIVVMWPALGGWLLDQTSYPILFGATAILTIIAHGVSWRLHASPARRELILARGKIDRASPPRKVRVEFESGEDC